jgi:2-deoxy-D-gluconate 3-dehydrogenase
MILDQFSLKGKGALVTGGSRGLGRAIALGLAEAGADIALIARTERDLAEAAEQVDDTGATAWPLATDLRDIEGIADAVAKARRALGRLDIVVNAAGTIARVAARQYPESQWDPVLDLNLKAVFFVCQAAANIMMDASRGGSIINIASLLSVMGRPTIPAYAASKGGVVQLTKALAVEWAPHGIRVNAIGPGYFETEMTRPLRDDPKLRAWVNSRIPMGRWGRPNDLQGAAVFLASDASAYVTGQAVYVDGGWLAG